MPNKSRQQTLLVEEASRGDTIKASKRLEVIRTFEVFEINQ